MPLGIAVSAVSAAALGYEVLLMRLFSIVQWHHFAYMIISLALLGIGGGGTILSLARRPLEAHARIALPAAAALFGAGAPAAFAVAQQVPFNPLELAWDARQPAYLALVYLVLAVPFVFSGGFIGLALFRFRARAARIYRFDLVGAGAGALGVLGALFVLEPGDCLRLIGGLGFAAAALACLDRALRPAPGAAAALAAAGLAVAALVPEAWLAPRISPYKPLSQALAVSGAETVAERSSPRGLITAVASPTVPFRHAPGLSLNATAAPPEQRALFTDGGAPDAITRLDGAPAALDHLGFQIAALPYHLVARPRVLALGAGGGAEVLRALHHGARRVDAVEADPQVIELVADTFGDFAGNLYGRDDVRVRAGDPRAFAETADETYDVVALSLPGAAGGARALIESNAYTVEAFAAYLARLAPGGVLAVTGPVELPPRSALKLVATASAALERAGAADPGARMALVRGWDAATLAVKNGRLGEADIAAVRDFAAARSFDLAWLPGLARGEANRTNVLAAPYIYDGARALLGPRRGAYLDAYKFHVAPATDDRPYFFRFFRWKALPELLELRGRGGNALIEWGYLVLIGTLAQAVVAAVVLIVVPLLRLPRAPGGAGEGARVVVYFFALGLGFLFVEIAFLQRFTLFLGDPVVAASAVLAAFLVFAGLGSGASARLAARVPLGRAIAFAVAGVAAVALAYLVALPAAFAALAGLPGAARFAAAVALVAPLAFGMGMPFPLGLARLSAGAPGWIPWAWAINGCASVIAAVLATVVAIHAGFSVVVAAAVALYVAAALCFARPPAAA